MWYYIENDENKGPVNPKVLRDLRERNVLPPDTPVWTDGMGEWIPLHEARLGGEGSNVPRDEPNREATSAGGPAPFPVHTAGSKRSRSRKVGIVALLLLAVFGLVTYVLYPFLPHEYLYDRGTAGIHSRYPLPGEDYGLLSKRFAASIVRDGEIREGRAIRIENGACEHLVWVKNGRVEAILIQTVVDTIDAPTVAADFLNHSSRAGTFEPRDEGLWWNPRHEVAMAIKSEGAILIASERGLALLEDLK